MREGIHPQYQEATITCAGGKVMKTKDMSYADFLDYWIDNYARINLKYSLCFKRRYLNKYFFPFPYRFYQISSARVCLKY